MDYGILGEGAQSYNVVVKFAAPTQTTSNAPVFVSDSVSLRRHAVSQRAQRWEITTNLMPENASRTFFLHNISHGFVTPFYVRAPQPYGIEAEMRVSGAIRENGTAGNTLSVSGTKGLSTLNVSVISTTKKIPAGTFVNIGASTKLYVLLTDITSSTPTCDIYPALRETINATLIYLPDNVRMKATYDPDVSLGIKYIDGVLSDPGQIKLIESL